MSETNGGAPIKEPEQIRQDAGTRLFGPDGELVENWHTLAPEGYEELRESKTLPRIKKFWDLGKSYENVRKQVPLEKIPRPNENFTDSDWNEFYDAGGRPKTPQDFNIVKPKDYPDVLWSDDRAKKYQDFFHKIGLNKRQVDAIVVLNNQDTLALQKEVDDAEERDFNLLQDALRTKWGAAYDQKVHIGNVAVEKGSRGDLDYKERLLDKINADPDLIEFASNIGSLFVEQKVIETPQIPTPADIDARISAEMQKPAYLKDNHPDHKRQVQLVQQLFEEKQKYKKVS